VPRAKGFLKETALLALHGVSHPRQLDISWTAMMSYDIIHEIIID
jgi:hypothetical protein